MEKFHTFNYHTHTKRCGHAGTFAEEEYIELAKQNGITTLGFSDHIPFTIYEYPEIDMRMELMELEEYIREIKRLKLKHQEIEILLGFEAEYEPKKETFLTELKEKADYMILGQHYLPKEIPINSKYPLLYAKTLCEAMETGIFDIVAHPDYFMLIKEELSKEEQKKFDINAVIASKFICIKAKELGLPLEINLKGAREKSPYPSFLFWKVCEEIGASVIYGVDAHDPVQFNTMEEDKKEIDEKLKVTHLQIVENSYNPVTNRKSNGLEEKYNKRKMLSYTYETHLVNEIMKEIVTSLPETDEIEHIKYIINELLNNKTNEYTEDATKNDNYLITKLEGVAASRKLGKEEKTFKLSRIKKAIATSNLTLTSKQNLISKLKETVEEALNLGAKNQRELIDIVTKLTEIKTTKQESNKRLLIEYIEEFKKNQTISSGMETSAKKVLTNSAFQTETKETPMWTKNGFVKITSLSLIISFTIGVGVGIAYMILKINNIV